MLKNEKYFSLAVWKRVEGFWKSNEKFNLKSVKYVGFGE